MLITYFFPVRQTTEVYQENNLLKGKLEAAQEAPNTIKQVKSQLESYKLLLRNIKVDSLKQEEYIIDQVSKACQQYGVTVVAFAPPDKYTNGDYRLNNRIIQLKGPYKRIIQVVDALERRYSVGRLASINFILKEEQWKRTSDLFAYIYIQNIQTIGNEIEANNK